MPLDRILVRAAAATVAVALVSFAAAPAFADPQPLPGNGVVPIGVDTQWQFDGYGLAYGWDQGNVYNSNGYIYYPNEFYTNDYAYCDKANATMNVEDNGDVTVVCPAAPWGSTGLTQQLTFRLYGETATGALLREVLTVTNPSDTAIDISTPNPLREFYYQYETGVQGTAPFTTSGGSHSLAPTDTWYVKAAPDGSSVAEGEAWALAGSADANQIQMDGSSTTYQVNFNKPADQAWAPGEVKTFASFTNMVIPTAVTSDAATAAVAVGVSQASEFSSFSGRLTAGLPDGLTVVGWGTVTPPAVPALAATGAPTVNLLVPAGAAALLLLAGGILIARRRARA